MHSSLASDDDFDDLGPPVIQGVNTRLKLATEKREFFIQPKDDYRNSTSTDKFEFFMQPKDDSENSTASKPDMKIPSARDLLMSLDKSSHTHAKIEKSENTCFISEKSKGTCPKTEKRENFSKIPSNNKSPSNIQNSSSVSIENIPSGGNTSKLLDPLSTSEKISSAVKYENDETSSRAISSGNVKTGSFNLPSRPLRVPESITIRIKGIGNDTAYTAVHSICKTVGELVGMVKATENSVHALFNLKDHSETQNILAELNDKIVDNCKWSAHLLANTSSPKVDSKYEHIQLGLQVSDRINMIKNEMFTRKIYAEDLQYMHLAIMHLEEQHDSGSTTNQMVL